MAASCFHVNTNFTAGDGGNKTLVKGEGPTVTRSYDLAGFDAVHVNGQGDVEFIQSEGYSVTLASQENVFEYIDMRLDGSTLVFEVKKGYNVRAKDLDLTLCAPSLKEVKVNGSADFDIPAGLSVDGDVSFKVNGAGDLDLKSVRCATLSLAVNGAAEISASDIDVSELKVLVNGAGDATISGRTVDADFQVNGAGDIDARGLEVSGHASKRAPGFAKIRL